MFSLFRELLLRTSGDILMSFEWMNEIDQKFPFTRPDYGMADFIKELEDKGFITRQDTRQFQNPYKASSKLEIDIRKSSFEEIFGRMRKTRSGNHSNQKNGRGDEIDDQLRNFEFGDDFERVQASESLKNAYLKNSTPEYLEEADLVVSDRLQENQCSTVLMIDISHSMILYGEDRITPAKKVGLALAHMITQFYPKDTLDVIVFGDDAWKVELKDLPFLEVGPYHTNTVAGLELAIDLLNKRRNPNKMIMMITDGKPSCIKKGKEYYKNSFGLDRQIIQRTLGLAVKCRRLQIDINTFMVASDPYLIEFIEEFTKANQGKSFYTSLDGLGEKILVNYKNNRKKNSSR
ncbi:MAG: hypothetical protein M3Q56_09110 [Bacteroidota bacterium]|nr:hypothetical protein [Bacteroidota bacterium]